MHSNARPDPNQPRELIVLSDLHIGRGKNPETGRFYALEAFFYDDDFLRFCRYLCTDAIKRGVSLRIILNGDVFDLLRIEPEAAGDSVSVIERRYGVSVCTPELAARLMRQVLGGHPGLVRGLAELLSAGHEVIFLPGNHDLEIQWEGVQAEIRQAIESVMAAEASPRSVRWALSHLSFRTWFYYEPGRIWIEHGCQYDPENAFRYVLRGDAAPSAEAVKETELDLPLGNFFQRYLYNGFGHITFIVPNTRANARYLKYLLLNQPRLLLGVLVSHLPFAFQVLRRIAKATVQTKNNLKRLHEDALAGLAQKSGLGDKLGTIDKLKEVNADALHATRSLTTQLVLALGAMLLVALSAIGLWFVGFLSINELRAGFGLKALLFLALNFFMVAAAGVTITYSLLRPPPALRIKTVERAAQRIAEMLDVPIVAFGHTHEEELARLHRAHGGRAWYYNTGTWIAVFTHDVLMPRERVQYTFLRVRGDQGELIHWSPGRGEPLPVILLDETSIDGWGTVTATAVPRVSDTASAAVATAAPGAHAGARPGHACITADAEAVVDATPRLTAAVVADTSCPAEATQPSKAVATATGAAAAVATKKS